LNWFADHKLTGGTAVLTTRRCSLPNTLALLLTIFALVIPMAGARASHETIVIDGDLTDLIQAVNDNIGAANGGFSAPDNLGDTYTGDCAYVNGYDLRNVYVFVDFFDAMGNYTPNDVTLYAGWNVEGVIGDVDGDGNPDTFSPGSPGGSTKCALSDEAGIGPNESYNILVDLDCQSPIEDLRIQVKNGQVAVVIGGVPTVLPNAEFDFDGSNLEVKIPDYQDLVAQATVDADLCNARFRLTANAEFDGPGEDLSSAFQLEVPPSVTVTKTPDTDEICAGQDVVWTVVVKNDGLCMLNTVNVYDTLGTGLTFEDADPVPASVDGQILSWNFIDVDLAPGDSIVIEITTGTGMGGPSVLDNDVTVEAVHESPCRTEPEGVSASAEASVDVRELPACNIDGDDDVCVGNTKTYTTTVGAEYNRVWSASSNPPGICSFVGGNTGGSVQINFNAAGTCTVKLVISDPADPTVCNTMCTYIVDVHPQPPCDIDGPEVVCADGSIQKYFTTVGDGYNKQWSFESTPGGICAIIGPADGDTVCVQFTGEGDCTVTLVVTDPDDPEDCRTECDMDIEVREAPPCDIEGPGGQDPITESCVGDTLEFSTPHYPAYEVTWSVGENPPGTCTILGPTDEGTVTVVFTDAGLCTLKLTVVDPANPDGCDATCELILTSNPLPPCDIEGPETASPGETITLCTPLSPDDYIFEWSATSDPDDICMIDGRTDTTCVDITFSGAGVCTVKLIVRDKNNPDVCMTMCTYEVTAGGEACPRTIGFWRQQCAQRGNGSTKICLEGMYDLWRCVIEETGVIQWRTNTGGTETTAQLAALTDAQLFERLCAQLQGPRPMTNLDMAELQYLGLMLNVCSGALPLNTPIDNYFEGTVGEAIEAIENAINTGQNVNFWKDVADQINNRIGVLAADCEEDVMRNQEACLLEESDSGLTLQGIGDRTQLATRPSPNPVTANAASIFYFVPDRLGSADVKIVVFNVAGQAIRTLVSANQAAGEYTVDWDLRDEAGAAVSSGIYFYRLSVGDESITEKMMVVRK
jgi:uncharacterized repeat protein (TIGR01451 family)